MAKPDGGPAFPTDTEHQPSLHTMHLTGMSLRDYALIAFQAALISQSDGYWAKEPSGAAKRAAQQADAMLSERAK
jgi:hypothetical protein